MGTPACYSSLLETFAFPTREFQASAPGVSAFRKAVNVVHGYSARETKTAMSKFTTRQLSSCLTPTALLTGSENLQKSHQQYPHSSCKRINGGSGDLRGRPCHADSSDYRLIVLKDRSPYTPKADFILFVIERVSNLLDMLQFSLQLLAENNCVFVMAGPGSGGSQPNDFIFR